MKFHRLPSLVLAIALQILPICRVALVNQAQPPSTFAIALRWLACAAVALGGLHAVSGASAAIAGVASISPPGPVTTNATGTAGQSFGYRIIVTNPGVNPQQAYYDAEPLPPGLTINTNIGGNGFITGTPTQAGTFPVMLTAGNANFVGVVTKPITITISGTGSPPAITGPPTNQTVTAGTNVTFSVVATASQPLTYVWSFAGTALTGATVSTLVLTNVQPTNSGTYTVKVSDSAGSTNASAVLTVNTLSVLISLGTPSWANGSFAFDIAGPSQRNYVIWISTDLGAWTALQTNFSASGTLHWVDTSSHSGPAFYRASLGP